MKILMNIFHEVVLQSGCDPQLDEQRLNQALHACLEGEGHERASVTIICVDEADSAELHQQHFSIPGSTDVMSFPDGAHDPELDCNHVGDVVVCPDLAQRLLREHNSQQSLADEVLLYIVHGTLHCLGFDDHEDEDRNEMWQRQKEILNPLGIIVNDQAEPD